MNKKSRPGGPNTAQKVLSQIHKGNAGASDERAHMIADITALIATANQLVTNVAGATGQVLNTPALKSVLTRDDATELTTLATNLIRDSQTYSQSLANLVDRFEQAKQLADWPDFLAQGLAISSELADWQLSYGTVVLPIKEQIDARIQTVIRRTNHPSETANVN